MPSSLGANEKVESSYYSPDFDPKKIPKRHQQDRRRWTQKKDERANFEISNHMQIRTMAPFNIRCSQCGTYTNKGTKIQANVDRMPGMVYLERITIWRFHVRCPVCRSVIVFRTDPENQDYDIVSGGTRSFRSAYVRAREEAEASELEKEIEDNNPMKLLEDRTFASKRELEDVELVEDLIDARRMPSQTDAGSVANRKMAGEVQEAKVLIQAQIDGDEAEIKKMLLKQNIAVLDSDDSDDDQESLKPQFKFRIGDSKSSSLAKDKPSSSKQKPSPLVKKSLAGIVIKKRKSEPPKTTAAASGPPGQKTSKFAVPSLPNFPRPSTSQSQGPSKLLASDVTEKTTVLSKTSPNPPKPSAALLGLGAYSDSDTDSD